MSKEPRTLTLLNEVLDDDYSWRITELSNYKNSIPKDRNTIQISLIRAGITLLYAHWEGFVKFGTNQYYNYISYQDHNISDFQSSLIAILLSSETNDILETKKITKKTFLYNKIIDGLSSKANFPNISPIRTSNLRFDIFEDVCTLLNIDINDFALKDEFIINSRLVDRRNTIAHGKYLDIEYRDFNELYRSVINILRIFKDKIVNAAVERKYLRA